MAESILQSLHAVWQKRGAVAIEELRRENPVAYLMVIAYLAGEA